MCTGAGQLCRAQHYSCMWHGAAGSHGKVDAPMGRLTTDGECVQIHVVRRTSEFHRGRSRVPSLRMVHAEHSREGQERRSHFHLYVRGSNADHPPLEPWLACHETLCVEALDRSQYRSKHKQGQGRGST